jgi:hypothetical protein
LIKWQDDATNAAPEERATVCDLQLLLNHQNVTEHVLNGDLADHLTIALYGIADGIVHDWWMIFGARDRDFSLSRYRTGYLIPDVRIQFDGAVFKIEALQLAYTNPNLRFWGGTQELLSREDGEAWLSSLVDAVLARLEAKGIAGSSAEVRWSRVQSSLGSEDERFFCEAAGSLGLDPYQIADDAADFIEKSEAVFTQEALVEFVAGARNVQHSSLIGWVDRMVRTRSLAYRLAKLRSIVDEVERGVPLRPGEAAWSIAYRRARAVRQVLGLRLDSRFPSFRHLASLMGGAKNYNLAPAVDGISALRREAFGDIHVHIRNHGQFEGSAAAHLFALARAIGDAACFPEAQASPINRLPNAYRQAAGRAFAAEFLAPIDEIRSMQEDERDEYSIANEFGVSTMVVQHQVENAERIERACA